MPQQRGGLTPEQRREARRELLLDAALDLFARQGYLATSIEELCRHAHVSTKSFYEVFDSREACYLDLMHRMTVVLQDGMRQVLADAPAVIDEAFTAALIESLAHLMADDPRRATVLFGRGSATTFAVEHERRTNRRWSAGFLQEVWARLDPPVVPERGVATGVIGGLFDLVSDWVFDSDDLAELHADDLARSMQAFWRVVSAGISA